MVRTSNSKLVRLKRRALALARLAQEIDAAQGAALEDVELLSQRFATTRDRYYDAAPASETAKLKVLTQQVDYYASRLAVTLQGLRKYTVELRRAAVQLKRH
jgi:hypothetical protein